MKHVLVINKLLAVKASKEAEVKNLLLKLKAVEVEFEKVVKELDAVNALIETELDAILVEEVESVTVNL